MQSQENYFDRINRILKTWTLDKPGFGRGLGFVHGL